MAEKTWRETGDGNELARSILHPNKNGQFDLADHDNGLPIRFADSANLDAFSRLRVGIPQILWEEKSLYDKNLHTHQEIISGGGSSSTYRSNESSIRLTAGTGATDKVIRQTKKYIPYIPGHSQTTFITFNLTAQPVVNNYKRVGRFDDNNGMFIEWNNTDIRAVIRTDTSGSASDAAYWIQADWNLDTLNGSRNKGNPSGINLDLTKTQILVIDFQWLGVGRVRFGFDIDGNITYFHEVNHANIDLLVYMRTPNLPIRTEVSNSSTTSGANSLDSICSSVVSEGSLEPLGHDYSISTGVSGVSVGQTRVPVMAFRQSLTYNSKVNRRIAFLNSLSILSLGDNIIYEVVQYPDPDITITGGWVDLDVNHSSMQYAIGTNITVNSETGAHPFFKDYVTSATQGSKTSPGAISQGLSVRTHHNEMLVNYDGTACEVIVIWATALSATGSTVYGTGNFVEYD